jgi:hypothetical protein
MDCRGGGYPYLLPITTSRNQKAFRGLRRLADETGLGADWVSNALNLRCKMFHGLRVTAEELRKQAESIVPELEDLWHRLNREALDALQQLAAAVRSREAEMASARPRDPDPVA